MADICKFNKELKCVEADVKFMKDWCRGCIHYCETIERRKSRQPSPAVADMADITVPNKKEHRFTLKDSGQREAFESGMVRDIREGKGRYDLISPIALRRLAIVYEKGAVKYEDRNWEKGAPMSRFMDSALRHLNQYKEGKRDEDHIAQACWNLFAMLHFDEVKPELNDLPSYFDVL